MIFENIESKINFLKGLIQLGALICICYLCRLSSKFPFESHIIGNMTDYFYDIPNTSSSDDIIEYKPLSKRHLEFPSFCDDILNSFKWNKGRKLSYIFDYNIVRRFSISIIVLYVLSLILSVLFVILKTSTSFKYKKNNICIKKILIIIQIALTLNFITKFIYLFFYITVYKVEMYKIWLIFRL